MAAAAVPPAAIATSTASHRDPTSPNAATTQPSKLANFTRAEFEDTCLRRFFFGLAFDPYGGTAGLWDLGPPMCAMKANFLSLWRQHFVLEENMCEVDCTCITPEEVFIHSGHVERFNDVMTRDTATGECFRLDKHLEDYFEKKLGTATATTPATDVANWEKLKNDVGSMTLESLQQVVDQFKVLSPKGNPLSAAFPFNLMFKSMIGPEGTKVGYMRPELAQGIILNFKRLLDSNNASRLPFAGACVGQAFRNEIAPRASLLRVREFTLAEIEHFLNPADKRHQKFSRVADVRIWAWNMDQQEVGADATMHTIGELVASKTIDNETLGYFIGRACLFLQKIGVRFLRFRQHRRTEKAHYAQDCWDAEILTSYGWVECVGIADRSAYDLTAHSRGSGKELSAREEFDTPIVVRVLDRKINKGVMGKAYGKDTGAITAAIMNLSDAEAKAMEATLASGAKGSVTLPDGRKIDITREVVSFVEKDERQTGRNFTPAVVEPSFGIGRILYSVLEQAYWVRRDESGKNEKRAVFSFLPVLAPQKVAIFPLMMKPELEAPVGVLRDEFVRAGISCRVDDSGAAIGKKYARVDELGIPFAVTVDYEADGTVTLRERDSSKQVRVPKTEVVGVVVQLCATIEPRTWDSVIAAFPEHKSSA